MKSTYLAATQKSNSKHIPVWFMRQAGRYLPEYMEIKNRSSFYEMSHSPNLISEISLQPIRRYHLDAAIIFSDILTCLEYMGAPFRFTDSGPKLDTPRSDIVPSIDTLLNLKPLEPQKNMDFINKGIQLIKKELNGLPLIGFAGAPFTLASYLIEGGTSKDFVKIKKFIFSEPELFKQAMNHLATEVGGYLNYKIACGVDAVQIFDSWVGILSDKEYEKHILPHMQKIISIVKEKYSVPVVLFSQPSTHLLHLLIQTGVDVLSVDWRSPLIEVTRKTERKVAIQGNLDPIALTLPWEQAKPYVQTVLEEARTSEILNQFIFNVGQGITPFTNTETVKQTIDLIHSFR